jgi:hypothetical protein
MTKKKTEVTPIAVEEVLKGYKAYDADLKCRGFQYEIGKTYEVTTPPVRCRSSGFHWVENPMDMWSYYDLTTCRMTEVEASGAHDRGGDDTKIASAKITVGVELHLGEVIKRAVNWMLDHCKASGIYSKQAASGHYSMQAASGDSSTQAASGIYSKQAASGDSSTQAASGIYSKQAASGIYSKQAASGYGGKVKIGPNGAAALAWHDGKRPRFTVLYAGEDGILNGVWYQIGSDGKPVVVDGP